MSSVGVGLLWVATTQLVRIPGGYSFPVVVPALGLAALMAWAQALAWMPIAVRWLREVINLATVTALATLPVWLVVNGRVSTVGIAALLVGYIVAALVVGWAAVSSDRGGRTWRLWPAELPAMGFASVAASRRRERPFRSAMAAQVWYEWNCHWVMQSGFVAVGLVSVWSVLLAAGRHGDPEWFATIIRILLVAVVVIVASTGVSFGRFSPFWIRTTGIATLVTVRPITTRGLVMAKFRMSAQSVLINWTLAVVLTALWIVLSGNLDNAAIMARDFLARFPGGRAPLVFALACVLLPTLSWRLLTGPVTPVLAGRPWVDQAAVWTYLGTIVGLGGYGMWLANHPEYRAGLDAAVPWLVVGLAIVKGILAVTAFRTALRRELWSGREIVAVLGLWLFLATCAVALAVLARPVTGLSMSMPVLALAPPRSCRWCDFRWPRWRSIGTGTAE